MGQSSKFGYGAMLAVATHWDSWARGTRNTKVSLGTSAASVVVVTRVLQGFLGG
jgi:hypothetical protein